MSEVSRRQVLGWIGVAGAAVAGCQINPKSESAKSPGLVFGTSETGLAVGDGAEHTLDGHPESHLRAKSIIDAIAKSQSARQIGALTSLPHRISTIDELRLVHDAAYIQKVQNTQAVGEYFSKSKWSPYGGPMAFNAAASAAACATDLIRAVSERRVKNGFAITRPPGHHAQAGSAGGYCIFNNIAVGVRALQRSAKYRVAIVDIDQHHGNGIQDAFYADADVLYVSTHQDEWPYTGKIEMTGEGAGKGCNINIALPPGTGDKGLAKAYDEVVIPALRRFKPDLVVVAAGFDTHWRDYQGSFICSLQGMDRVVKMIHRAAQELCEGRIAYVLEGGYQLQVLASASLNLIHTLTNTTASLMDPFGSANQNERDVSDVIRKIRRIHHL